MRTYDFSPLYRSTVGFDRLFDMLDQSARAESPPNWPPYNIERTSEDDYRITMALAGFSPDEIELVQGEHPFRRGPQEHRPGAGCGGPASWDRNPFIPAELRPCRARKSGQR